MKVVDLFEKSASRPKPPKPKARPKKTLWFNNYSMWATDIMTRNANAKAYVDEENEEVVLGGADDNFYGVWDRKNKRGVTYHQPRPLHAVSHSTRKIREA